MKEYDLSKFSPTPYGRYPKDGKYNGTTFRNILIEELNKAKTEKQQLVINFDNILLGIGSSFLEEAFGGLVRKGFFTKEELIEAPRLLEIKSNQPFYKDEIEMYIREATKE